MTRKPRRRSFAVGRTKAGRLKWRDPGPQKDSACIGAPWADAYLQGAFDGMLCPGCGVYETAESGVLCERCQEGYE